MLCIHCIHCNAANTAYTLYTVVGRNCKYSEREMDLWEETTYESTQSRVDFRTSHPHGTTSRTKTCLEMAWWPRYEKTIMQTIVQTRMQYHNDPWGHVPQTPLQPRTTDVGSRQALFALRPTVWGPTVWRPTVPCHWFSISSSIHCTGAYSLGLQPGRLSSRATDFRSRQAFIALGPTFWGPTLWETTVSGHGFWILQRTRLCVRRNTDDPMTSTLFREHTKEWRKEQKQSGNDNTSACTKVLYNH